MSNEDIFDNSERVIYTDNEDYYYCDYCTWEGSDIFVDRDNFDNYFVRCPDCGAFLDY